VVCFDPEVEERDQQVRANLVVYLTTQIDGTDEWSKSKRDELTDPDSASPRPRRSAKEPRACSPRWATTAVPPGSAMTRRMLLRPL